MKKHTCTWWCRPVAALIGSAAGCLVAALIVAIVKAWRWL
jgi:hypothetical protein